MNNTGFMVPMQLGNTPQAGFMAGANSGTGNTQLLINAGKAGMLADTPAQGFAPEMLNPQVAHEAAYQQSIERPNLGVQAPSQGGLQKPTEAPDTWAGALLNALAQIQPMPEEELPIPSGGGGGVSVGRLEGNLPENELRSILARRKALQSLHTNPYLSAFNN